MTRNEIIEFLFSTGQVKWDEKICPKFRYPQDFDEKAFRYFVDMARITTAGMTTEDILVNIGIAERFDDSLVMNNTGVLFFAKEPTRFHRHAVVDCILFQGIDKVDILDRNELCGNLMENVKQAMIFLNRHLSVRYEIKGLHRKEILEVPEDALREGVLNAVIHRDYHFDGANVTVEVYRDRVEISDPGGLPPGMRFEDLGTKSVRRNKLIADLFHRLGEVEKVGSGIGRIRTAVAQAGLPEPEFTITSFYTLRFRKSDTIKPEVLITESGETTQKTTQKTTQNQRAIMEYLTEHPFASRRELTENIDGITDSGVKYNLKRLQELGFIRRVGPDKGGHWEVIK